MAALEGKVAFVRTALESLNADPNAKCSDGSTVLQKLRELYKRSDDGGMEEEKQAIVDLLIAKGGIIGGSLLVSLLHYIKTSTV